MGCRCRCSSGRVASAFTMYDSARIQRPHGTAFRPGQYTWRARAKHTCCGADAMDGPAAPPGRAIGRVECRYHMYHCSSSQHLHFVHSDTPCRKRIDIKQDFSILYRPEQHYLLAFDRTSLRVRPPVAVHPPSPAAAVAVRLHSSSFKVLMLTITKLSTVPGLAVEEEPSWALAAEWVEASGSDPMERLAR